MPTSKLRPLLDLLYPLRCALCGLLGQESICDVCRASFVTADRSIADPEWRGALDGVARLYRYEGRAGQAVQRLKYARATALAAPMAHELLLYAEALGVVDFDLVVPVPIHWTRRCYRGFNQSDLLCAGFNSEQLQPRCIARVRATRPQTSLNPDQRKINLRNAFKARPDVAGQSVLLVDDVITTGHTVGECAKALKAAGATQVVAMAFAGG